MFTTAIFIAIAVLLLVILWMISPPEVGDRPGSAQRHTEAARRSKPIYSPSAA